MAGYCCSWEHFNELDRKGLMMFGQMTAGSWIYIASQGIIQGTYETFSAVAKTHFEGKASGRWVLTGGLGGMGGAQPLAATFGNFCMLAVECDESRVDMRLRTGYVDHKTSSLDEALAIVMEGVATGTPVSVGLIGNAADVYGELVRRGVTPDVVTDQTSAHDPLNGYLPQGRWDPTAWASPQGRRENVEVPETSERKRRKGQVALAYILALCQSHARINVSSARSRENTNTHNLLCVDPSGCLRPCVAPQPCLPLHFTLSPVVSLSL